MSELQHLIDERLTELGLSSRAAALLTNGKVSHTTISKIRKGEHRGKLSDEVIEGLAVAARLPVERIARAANQRYRPPTEYVLPPRAKNLRPEMWESVLDHLDAMLALQERLEPPLDDREEG